jgi:nitrite reductase (NADH) small subunit
MTLVDNSVATGASSSPSRWTVICDAAHLIPDRGVAALVDDRAVAVFLLTTGEVHAIDNVDPCSGASVLSRGIVGEAAGVPTVASPMYTQRFDLRTGRCLDDDTKAVAVHGVRVLDGTIHVRVEPSP